jgi:hypothetical protein
MQFADWFAPVKISNSTEYSVLHALQFQMTSVRHKLPSETGINYEYDWPNQRSV